MKCYISCPISIPQWQLDLVQKRLKDAKNAAVFWQRGTTYGEQEKGWIKTCDAFVLVLPNFDWQATFSSLPKGCKAELDSAIKQNKDIYIAYRGVMNNALAIYKADVSLPGHIRGIPQTYNVLGQSGISTTAFVQLPARKATIAEVIDGTGSMQDCFAAMHDALEEKVVQYEFTFDFPFKKTYDRRLLLLM